MPQTQLDPATNMPVVPEGYFWRVDGVNRFGFAYVELRDHRGELIGSQPLYPEELTDKKVFEAAERMLRYNRNVLVHFGKVGAPNLSLVGDYPPKKLAS